MTFSRASLAAVFIGAIGFNSSVSWADGASVLRPNELGQVMILEYHQIGAGEAEWRRTPDNFRKDLQNLFDRGFALINLCDLLDGKITTPAGKTPVVLTFDDGATKQFTQNSNGWDPDSAVGIILEFAKTHPDFGVAGTFYVNLISSKQLGSPRGTNVLQDLVRAGFEIGNHTMTHPKLSKLSQSEVAREIAGLQKFIGRNVPGYRVRSIALPFGIYPKLDEWARVGEYENESYAHDAMLEVGSGPSPSPFSSKFRFKHIPRIQARDEELTNFYRYFEMNPGQRFVSDGNEMTIAIPKGQRKNIRAGLDSRFSVVEL